MIVDIHTHVFPPALIEQRERLLADPTFAELYGSPAARLATADDLLASMTGAHVDVSVALGFAWADVETCGQHNDYLLEAAAGSEGRIVAFCTLPLAAGIEAVEAEMRRCSAAGAHGFGELRPDNLGFDLNSDAGTRLASLARELDTILLFHVSEPVGHDYPGNQGLSLSSFYQFVVENPGLRLIGAHWAGGLPFYALMPEVRLALHDVYFDTAASSLLYAPEVYANVSRSIRAEHVLFGSDFPLLSQARSRKHIEEAGLSEADQAAILGGNASRLLGLDEP